MVAFMVNVSSIPLAFGAVATSLACATTLSCATPKAAEPTATPETAEPPTPATPAPPPAQRSLPAALRGVSEEADLVGYVDLAVLDGWAGRPAAVWLLSRVATDLLDSEEAVACIAPVLATGQPLTLAHFQDATEFGFAVGFIGVELDEHRPAEVIACLTKAMPNALSEPIRGFPAVRGLPNSFVATPHLLLAGEMPALESALATLERSGATSPLVAKLPLDADVVLAAVSRGRPQIPKLDVTVRRDGDTLKGAATIGAPSERDAAKLLARIDGGLEHLKADWAPHLPEDTPLRRALFGARTSMSGMDLSLAGSIDANERMLANILAAIASREVARRPHEALQRIGEISRGAMAAYEREHAGANPTVAVHKRCESAVDVPADVPAGVSYTPKDDDGADFNTGDHVRGWRCMKFALTEPIHYRFSYRSGGHYKGPARGGPDPGPNGIEIAAEGDLDGDGKTSFFSRVGRIDPKTKRMVIDPDVFIVDRDE